MKQIKKIAVVAGGGVDELLLPDIKKAEYLIGVDRGAWWLLEHKIIPDVALGDFDSVTEGERGAIQKASRKFTIYPIEKDKTDLELAVEECITVQPTEVHIYGAVGTRADHNWAGILMLEKLESYNICGYIWDKTNKIHIVRRKQQKFSRDPRFRYVSVLALSDTATVTITGFKYPLNHHLIHRISTLGISNEITSDSAEIVVHDGSVLVVQTRD